MEEKDTIISTKKENVQHTLMEKLARILSFLFMPFLAPTIGFILLFTCTYLRLLPIPYKGIVLGIVFCFTLCMPMLIILLFQKINGWSIKELETRKRRFIPYLLTIASYITCLITMYRLYLPRYMSGIIVAALICMILCTLINIKCKISTHVASSGMFVGGVISYSMLFGFNPVNVLCIAILLSGILGTARIILNQHTLFEVNVGFVVGFLCGIIGILFI